jgi:hypothetical protein
MKEWVCDLQRTVVQVAQVIVKAENQFEANAKATELISDGGDLGPGMTMDWTYDGGSVVDEAEIVDVRERRV